MHVVEIPQINMHARDIGMKNILEVLAPVFQERGPVIFRFNYCHFISAEGVAILAGTKLMRDSKGLLTQIDMDTIDDSVKRLLGKSQFLKLFGHALCPSGAGNTLPIYKQSRLSKDGILNYIDLEIMKRHEMPEMSDDLRKEIRRAFFEVFGNVFYHSRSSIGGLVCGQVYPNSKEIQIVFYDAGVGIATRVREVEFSIRSDVEAIEWALKRGTSTLSNSSESRGLGLYLLRQFLRVNEGEFHIYANQGAVIEISGNPNYVILPCSLNGTLIDMRIRVRNDVKYSFSYEE
jgi:anti-sigma regulatory factor (Ser/Thr protein kinase)